MKNLTAIITGIFILGLPIHISGQSVVKVIGHVSNCATDSVLRGATVVHPASGKGAVSGPEGAFSLTLPVGRATLQISFLGYSAIDTSVVVSSGMASLKLCLNEDPVQYDEVVVTANERDFTESVRMGDVRISRSDLERLPKFLGEADPIRLLQLTPGVQSSTEGGVGFFVRGGSIDQNLVLYDGATVYNPGHLLGFVSAFNPDIISDVSLIKSGIPAAFGGRLSSVMQVKTDRGRSDSLKVQGQLGLVASRLTLSRSFDRKRGSFYASARGATLDLFIKPVVFPLLADVNPFLNQSSYFFYDYNGGVSYRIGERDYLSFSAFYSNDRYSIERSERMAGTSMAWGNLVMSAQWSHLFKDDARLHTSYSRTNYNFDLEGSQSEFVFSLLSSVKDDQFKSTFYKDIGSHRINAGIELTSHTFTPNEIDVSAGGLIMNFLSYNKLYAFEGGIFAEDEIELSPRLSISAGLRYSFFNQVGPYTEYFYDETSLLRDSLHYSEGTSLAFYHHPEPRISMRYTLSSSASLKASYMHMAQYIHLATSA
ncbi:MAG TPA: TonB-dependent receptor, partial [Bacteroidales bacterium]|nr:TonB-dependent receptor [Bacteroidales bacterium]